MSSNLGDRMKAYEKVSSPSLTRRVPVIIRVDGRAFHTFTKAYKFERPFCEDMHNGMMVAASYLMNDIQGAKIAYVQSDEISVLVTDYETIETEAWFAYDLSKMCSIAASRATSGFTRYLVGIGTLRSNEGKWPTFDARAFNMPQDDVVNYFVWRQMDATRNSIQMLGRAHFSHKELHQKNTSQIQDMLMLQKGINWNDIPTWQKRGFCVRKTETGVLTDEEMPILTQDRMYIQTLVSKENVTHAC